MPVYVFYCEHCKSVFELNLKVSTTKPARCPNCGHRKLTRKYDAPSIVYKTSGFYNTDNKK